MLLTHYLALTLVNFSTNLCFSSKNFIQKRATSVERFVICSEKASFFSSTNSFKSLRPVLCIWRSPWDLERNFTWSLNCDKSFCLSIFRSLFFLFNSSIWSCFEIKSASRILVLRMKKTSSTIKSGASQTDHKREDALWMPTHWPKSSRALGMKLIGAKNLKLN